MKGSHAIHNNNSPVEVIDLLWELKQLSDKKSSEDLPEIHFNLLLVDPVYRAKIIAVALNASCPRIQAVAHCLNEAELEGCLIRSDLPNNVTVLPTVPFAPSSFSSEASHLTNQASDLSLQAGNLSHLESHAEPVLPHNRTWRREDLTGFGRKLCQKQRIISALPLTYLPMVLLFLSMLALAGFLYYNTIDDLLEKKIVVNHSIVNHERWQAGRTYVLQGLVYVQQGATLTIDAGVTIKGTPGSALIVTRGSQLLARGTKMSPIVFTSSLEPERRQPGDWGGVVLLGSAPVNAENPHIEGIDESDFRGQYGGRDASSTCGVMEYVRIEYAGFEIYANNELNGLTLGACGNRTVIRNVQVHKSMDDGIEVFGGNVDLKNIVITGAGDDGLDWDKGWTGRAQFLLIQLDKERGDNAIEGDSHNLNSHLLPRSEPSISNATFIGGFNKNKAQRGMLLRRGTGGHFANIIVTGFSGEAVDVRGEETAENAQSGLLTFESMMFFNVGLDGNTFFQNEKDADDDAGFDEEAYFLNRKQVSMGVNPGLSAVDLARNQFSPRHGQLVSILAVRPPQGEFWDEGAQYMGAVPARAATTWMDGWTRFSD